MARHSSHDTRNSPSRQGYYFVTNTDGLKELIANSRFGQVSFLLEHYVVFAHLIGGFLIAVGLITRIAVLVQLPILIGTYYS
jgi:uncharacterized membrane protein YphA (DoxX/SURF4 family)